MNNNKSDLKVSATELERQIFEKEEIRVVIRCTRTQMFDSYNYHRKATGNIQISEWYMTRLKPLLGDSFDAEIINGNGIIPHGRIPIEKIRESYIK
jgi:hypothetical protein